MQERELDNNTQRWDRSWQRQGRAVRPVETAVRRQHPGPLPFHVLRNLDDGWAVGKPLLPATLPRLAAAGLPPGTCSLPFGWQVCQKGTNFFKSPGTDFQAPRLPNPGTLLTLIKLKKGKKKQELSVGHTEGEHLGLLPVHCYNFECVSYETHSVEHSEGHSIKKLHRILFALRLLILFSFSAPK